MVDQRPVTLVLPRPVTPAQVVVFSGAAFAVLDASTHAVVAASDVFAAHAHAQPIRAACFSADGRYLVTTGEDKLIKVWDAAAWGTLVNQRVADKRAVEVCVTRDGQTLVCADKHGDVWTFPLVPAEAPSNKPGAGGDIVVGHVSMVTAAKLAGDADQFLITADRDEKIRVSQFPKGFNIEGFCLGHTQFVAHIVVAGDLLLSAGGDEFVYLWNWREATAVANANIRAYVDESVAQIAVRGLAVHGSHVAVAVEGTAAVLLYKIEENNTALRYDRRVALPEAAGNILSLAYLPSGDLLVGTMAGLYTLPATAAATPAAIDLAAFGPAAAPEHKDIYLFETLRKTNEFEEGAGDDGEGAAAPKRKKAKKQA
ncbi:tRNA (guanine-N(7)-)-methyltransferase non-catalytic subunit trm82 [Blastocladiella emersonii ATCC 22665]|nr:tRNA (guanine-N(7)-)-methyltransferase non-catalytic subunit trm82 [Blastocladiella emersonii ATCC 22665]